MNLQRYGFRIITSIDISDSFKKNLNIAFRNYRILGACNPQFAYNALSLESHMGVMLPCNIVVQEHENGEVEISAINPLEYMDNNFNSTQLKQLATEIGNKLRGAIDDLHRETSEPHLEALPDASSKCNVPLQG